MSHFGRGFEAFGRPLPIRGMTPPKPVTMAAPPGPAPAQVPIAPQQPLQVQQQPQVQQQQQVVPPGRFRVYKKGEPGAPPCPVCG